MHLIRRAAFRAATYPSTSLISKPRSITTSSPFLLRSKVQNGIPSSLFRRFASDEANASREEKSSVESTHGQEQAESLRSSVEQATDSFVDAAAATAEGLGFGRREERTGSRPSYGERDGGRRVYDNNRGDRDTYRKPYDNSRGPTGARRPGGFQGDRPPRELNLAPTPAIYVGNLLFDVTASDLQKEFEQFGPVKSAVVASDARGLSKGFGYVEFETTEQATAAIEAKHQTVLEGRRLIVNYMASTKRESTNNPPSKTLFIGNLAFEMSDADLNKLFREIRNVVDVRVAIDRRTGQPRGFAHADFVDVESAVKGLEALVGKEVYGRKLRVDYSTGTRENRGDGSGHRGAGGSEPF